MRAVDCAVRMKSWDEVIAWCDRGLRLEAGSDKLKKTRITAMKEKVYCFHVPAQFQL